MIFHHSVIFVPFLLVLIMPKKVGVRCCLFFFMIICFALRFLEYIAMIAGNFYGAGYFVEQGNELSMTTTAGQTNQAEHDAVQKTSLALTAIGGQAWIFSWILVALFLPWLILNCGLMTVYWKFYATAKNIW